MSLCLARHPGVMRLGVAVSGGGDSMALLVLAAALPGIALEAVTIDHRLRPGSREEAERVADFCRCLGVPHQRLDWRREGQRKNLQQDARRARQALIGAWARERGLHAVMLGHTLDDQAETVLMRLARGSGVDGLAGMAEAVMHGGVLWLRPFLGVTRKALRDLLRARAIAWCEDPSNDNLRFQRVRARQALAVLAPLGVDAVGLAATAQRMGRARVALEAQTRAELGRLARDDRGTVMVDRAALALLPEIRDRVFAFILMALSGADHRPRLTQLQRWIAGAKGKGGPLMGCVLHPEGEGLRLFREYRAVAGRVARVGDIWDGRWQAFCEGTDNEAEIRALGEAGLRQLSAQASAGQHPHWRETGLPESALAAMPGIWCEARLIAAPLALWPNGWQITARPVVTPLPGEALSH